MAKSTTLAQYSLTPLAVTSSDTMVASWSDVSVTRILHYQNKNMNPTIPQCSRRTLSPPVSFPCDLSHRHLNIPKIPSDPDDKFLGPSVPPIDETPNHR